MKTLYEIRYSPKLNTIFTLAILYFPTYHYWTWNRHVILFFTSHVHNACMRCFFILAFLKRGKWKTMYFIFKTLCPLLACKKSNHVIVWFLCGNNILHWYIQLFLWLVFKKGKKKCIIYNLLCHCVCSREKWGIKYKVCT